MFPRFNILHNIIILLIFINLVVFYYAYYGPIFEPRSEGRFPYSNQLLKPNKERYLLGDIDSLFYKKNIIPILVISCKRPNFLSRTLTKIFQYHPKRRNPKSSLFPVIVSQACSDDLSKEVIQSFQENITAILYYNQNIELLKEKIQGSPKYRNIMDFDMILKYSRIADHYHTALNWTFGLPIDEDETVVEFKTKRYSFRRHKAVIILEDDLDISPDIFEYFNATYSLLEKDPTLYCVSAWNDNGKLSLVDTEAPEKLYRTDFFPGLGWMITKSLWLELELHWPDSLWDEYLREKKVRKGRQCIRPEISRTYTFGDVGVSQSQFYHEHLEKQYLNTLPVNFSLLNLNYLISATYPQLWLVPLSEHCKEMSAAMVFGEPSLPPSIRIMYKSESHYLDLATMFNLFPDLKEGIPRTSYLGIVQFKFRQSRVYLYPKSLKIK